jgi:hypothetical protein
MGDMTAVTLTVPLRTSCSRCGTGVAATNRFCSSCGSALTNVGVGAPVDSTARRTLQFGILMIAANIVVGAATFGVVYTVSGAPGYMTAALMLEGLHMLVVGALALQTIRLGVKAVQLARDGRTKQTPWPLLCVVVASLVLLSLLGSFTAVAAMVLGVL